MSRPISSRSSRIAWATPGSPPIAAANSIGRPMNTKSAPSASAFSTSVPRRTLPSSITVMSPATARTAGSARNGDTANPVACRRGWRRSRRRAGLAREPRVVGARMPLTTSRPRQRLRIAPDAATRAGRARRSVRVRFREDRRPARGAHVLEMRHAVAVQRAGGGVPTASRGEQPVQASRALGRSRRVKPLRMLFSRLGGTGTSAVTTNVPKPAAATRSTSGSMRAGSPGR